MHLGIVAEGPSDLILLEQIATQLHPDCTVSRLQPEATLGQRGAGWRAVRAWCLQFGQDLDLIMEADPRDPIDRLLIHVDCSMAHNVEANRPCPPSIDTANKLRSVVLESWLRMKEQPAWLHIATPSSSSDTWLAAVLAPPPAPGPIECLDQEVVENHLATKKLLRRKADGRVAKPARIYEALAEETVAQLQRLREACHLADVLCNELT